MYIQVQQDYCFSCCLMLTFFTWKSTCVFKKFFVKQPNLGGAKQFTWYTVNSRVKISHNLTGPRDMPQILDARIVKVFSSVVKARASCKT